MDFDLHEYSRFTVLLAFALAFVFASCCGMPRVKTPGETELTVAQVLSGRLPQRKGR